MATSVIVCNLPFLLEYVTITVYEIKCNIFLKTPVITLTIGTKLTNSDELEIGKSRTNRIVQLVLQSDA